MRMKLFSVLLFLFSIALVQNAKAQSKYDKENRCPNPNLVKDTSKISIPSVMATTIGKDSVIIKYFSPGVRGRIIWGGLVPYNEVWVTGAHDATSIDVRKDFKVGNKIIPAGKYAIFTIPGKNEWTVIMNKNWQQHLSNDYDEKEDVVRIKVKPQKTKHVVERLSYEIEPKAERTANIIIGWEKLRIAFPIEIN